MTTVFGQEVNRRTVEAFVFMLTVVLALIGAVIGSTITGPVPWSTTPLIVLYSIWLALMVVLCIIAVGFDGLDALDIFWYAAGILATIYLATKIFTVPDGCLWVSIPALVDFGIFIVLALLTFFKRTPDDREEMARNLATLKNIFTTVCLGIAGSCGGIPSYAAISEDGGASAGPGENVDQGGVQNNPHMGGGVAETRGDGL